MLFTASVADNDRLFGMLFSYVSSSHHVLGLTTMNVENKVLQKEINDQFTFRNSQR
jgi:hypothetical protein